MKKTQYIATIGLEIHAELKTDSKMFCSCANNPDEEKPNANVCPICLGHPGTLPVLNMQAIKHVLKVGVAVGGEIADFTEWDRKNYFYPDIPKGYQISQYAYPLVTSGELVGVALERIHLEEDTAQSTHDIHEKSLVNFNRSGLPLMELVTKPVIHDAATAVNFSKELQLLLRYLGAGEANMEKGEMRVEANISVASPADTIDGKFGTKTEVKNLNSFRAVERAIAFEIERQSELLITGKTVVQETRGWDDSKGETYSQRSKESSHDYRYFPDPDIPKLKISEIPSLSRDTLSGELPELPWVRRGRYKEEYAMTDKEVAVFVESPALAEYYEEVVGELAQGDAKGVRLATNYILTDYLKLIRDSGANNENTEKDIFDALWDVSPSVFAELIGMIMANELSSRGAKDLLASLFKDKSISAHETAKKQGLIQKSDTSDLIPAIEQVISANEKAVTEYKSGKIASLQFLIGQAMRATRGAGNPEIVKRLLLEKLG